MLTHYRASLSLSKDCSRVELSPALWVSMRINHSIPRIQSTHLVLQSLEISDSSLVLLLYHTIKMSCLKYKLILLERFSTVHVLKNKT